MKNLLLVTMVAVLTLVARSQGEIQMEAGVAVRDITPDVPIWLAGYAARNRPADQVHTPLLVQALALKNPTGDRMVLVTLDNCEVGREFIAVTLRELEQRHGLVRGAVMPVCSHTHSGPVLEGNLLGMYPLDEGQRKAIADYGQKMKSKLKEAVAAALEDLQPVGLTYAVGQAEFAMNRRVKRGDQYVFGENPDGPVDREVPVLKIAGTNGSVRAIVFGYACHATSIQGDDFYKVSGDYMAYSRRHIEAVYPGATAIFLTGMGADANPSPRGGLLHAQRHGLELAGAVVSVLQRPMSPVSAQFTMSYAEARLPFQDPPSRGDLEKDAQSPNPYIQKRAQRYLSLLERGLEMPRAVPLPMSVLKFGEDLMMISMAGEVVVDYAHHFKKNIAGIPLWTVGYAYEVPCYIPSKRILREGGYEAESSLIYYGLYGPFRPEAEEVAIHQMTSMINDLRNP